ncbi:MAG: ABC transporter ATP-binding protein [Bacteroidota bacterium]
MQPELELQGVSKRYQIGHLSGSYLSFRDSLAGLLRFGGVTKEDFWALNDVSFNVNPGETVGIIGRNGAGKSTLLKILSRITKPTKGKIIARGRIASLLEVGTGFHQELTGRENIFFNGSILGMKRNEIASKFDEIVAFSGTEKFLDTPLKHFSSGMQLRLAFSVAAFLEPEILIIDEVLAVGDAEFQRKCIGKMNDVSRSGRTILFVSHDLGAVSSLCKKVAVLQQGSLVFFGETVEALSFYQHGYKKSEVYRAPENKKQKRAYFKEVRVCNGDGVLTSTFMYDQVIRIEFDITINDPSIKANVVVIVLDSNKRRLFALESNELKEKISVEIDPQTLVRGTYSLIAYVNQPNIYQVDEINDVCDFEVIDNGSQMLKHGQWDYGSVFGRGRWS